MVIYRLKTNKVIREPLSAIVSSYRSERIEKKEEFYLSKVVADRIAHERREAIAKLAGFWDDSIEFIVEPVQVNDQVEASDEQR